MAVTRRQLLKRGTIAGLVWATPVINAVPISANAAQAASAESIRQTMSPERVLANGPSFDSPAVQNAITLGYAGVVRFTWMAGPSVGQFDFSFSNLTAGTYYVLLDSSGGSVFPFSDFSNPGTFVAETSGSGSFRYSPTLGAGAYNYSFWLNQGTSSVLQTDNDLSFTLP